MTKKNICVDCDGIVYDFIGFALNYLSKRTGKNFTEEEYAVDDFRKWKDYTKEDEVYFRSPGTAESLPLYSGAQEFIEQLKKRDLKVIYCTSPYYESPTWCHDRGNAIKRDFGDPVGSIIYAKTGQKKYVSGVTLIDDHPTNCLTWSDHNKKNSILFNRPWNKKFRDEELKTLSHRIDCAKNYEDVLSILDRTVLYNPRVFA